MILQLSAVPENAHLISLLAKEGLGVVARGPDAETHHPSTLLSRGGESRSWRERDWRAARKGRKISEGAKRC